jgi:hypothetical protein
MFILRAAGFTLLIIGLLALAYDGARMIATPSRGFRLTSIAGSLQSRATQSSADVKKGNDGEASGGNWLAVIFSPITGMPLSLLCSGAGALLFLAGYRPPPPEIVG